MPGAGVLVSLLLAALPLGAAQEHTGDAFERLDEDLLARLSAVDPRADGWTSEGRAEDVGGALKRLLAPLVGAEAESFPLDAACVATPLVPSEFESLEAGGALELSRGDVGAASALDAAGWRRRLQALRERFSAGAVLELDTHQVGVREAGDLEAGDLVEAEFDLHVDHRPGAHGLHLELATVWRLGDEGPLLRSLYVTTYAEVRARDGRTLFEEGSGWLAANADLARQFGLGISEWRERLDPRLGVPLLGHPAGVAIADVNGDGFEDLYLCEPGGLPNRLLLGRANGSVLDGSAKSGADFLDFSRAALLVHLDDDGHRDLVVTVGTELLFLAGDGRGAFGLRASVEAPETTSLAAADVDLDGDLDLYACAYAAPYDGGDLPRPYHEATNGRRNVLLDNRGEFRFVDVTEERGLEPGNRRFSFAASFEDVDLDGDPDLYVANDFGSNFLYINEGGHFDDRARAAGVDDVAAGMGVSFGDYDGDGDADLYVSNMFSSAGHRVTEQARFMPGVDPGLRGLYRRHARGNSLFQNRGDGTFADVSLAAGVHAGGWAWGARFVDLDGDGDLDLASPNGLLTATRTKDL